MSLRTIDLFCGCGGLSLGLADAGFDVVAGFDNWDPALAVYERNIPDHPAIKIDLGELENYAALASFAPDVVAGGPPCQDFSSAGKRDEAAGRGDLTPKFADIVTSLKPRWAIMENVERAPKTERYQRALQIMRDGGYGITLVVLDASLCGVPQKRKRAFAIAQLGGRDEALAPYISRHLADRPMTLRDYFGDELGLEHYYRHPRNYNRRGIYSIDEPSPTVRGVNRPVPKGYPGHRADTAPITNELRPLTMHERARIQTFPKDFVLEGPKTHIEQMVGNAVPVNLAAFVGRAILDFEREQG